MLACVIKHHSFTKAATEMKVSQAQLSKSISSLESKLGSTLVERDIRPVTLTAFGKSVLPYIENCIRENDELSNFIERHLGVDEGTVNIYSPSGFQAVLAQHVLPSLHSTKSNINITMSTWNQVGGDFYKGIYFDDECDILISYTLPKNENLIARRLRTVKFDVFSTDEFYNNNPIFTIEDFGKVPFILQKAIFNNNDGHHLLLKSLETKDITKIFISGQYMFDNALSGLSACRAGLGYLLASPSLLNEVDVLKPRLPETHVIEIPCYIIYRKRVNQPARVQMVINHIIENFQDGM